MLILDPSSNDVEQTANILRNNGHAVRTTQIQSEEDLENALDEKIWDIFIVRDNLKKPSAEKCLKIVQHYGLDIPFIMTTEDYSVERTLEALRLGMRDVIPEDNDEYFKLVVERELSNIDDRHTRESAEKILKETSKRNELLLESSRDAIAYITDGMHIYANLAYMDLFGYDDPEELECMPVMDLMEVKGHEEFKKYLKNHSKGKEQDDFSFIGLSQDGNTFEAYLSLTDSVYDGEDCTQIYIKTAQASDDELEQKLKELSAQDRLTGLFNQHYFSECVDKAINDVDSSEMFTAVLYIELDKYDDFQDKYGIKGTDQYLKEVSQWLKDQQSSEDILARIGDSTFAKLTIASSKKGYEDLADGLCKQFSEHLFEIDNNTVTDSLSIGICPISEKTTNSQQVLSNAHFVSNRVSSKGGNRFQIFDSALESLSNRDEATTAMELQEAMDAGHIYPLFAPIVKLHGKAEKIFNVKLAFDSEEGQRLAIDDAFPINPLSTTAIQLDDWLMTTAFKIFSEYLSGQSRCKLKIPLSAASLLNDLLVPNILDLLNLNNLPHDAVIFEFSEQNTANHLKQAIMVYKQMTEHGLISALSGFGNTSNCNSIIESINCKSLHWVSIKSSLFDNFTTDTKAQNIIRELLEFVHQKELISIAPGIADAGGMATIYPMGVHHIHGEYIGDASKTMSFNFSDIAF